MDDIYELSNEYADALYEIFRDNNVQMEDIDDNGDKLVNYQQDAMDKIDPEGVLYQAFDDAQLEGLDITNTTYMAVINQGNDIFIDRYLDGDDFYNAEFKPEYKY